MSLKNLIEDLVASHDDWDVNDVDGGWIIGLATNDDRSQFVHVEERDDPGGDAMILIWSEVGEASRFGDGFQLLDFNWKYALDGSLARRGTSIVLLQRRLAKTASPTDLEHAIQRVGVVADKIEQEIYGDLDLN